MKLFARLSVVALLATGWPCPLAAHDTAGSVQEPGKQLTPLYFDGEIEVDGKLDDDVWTRAEPSGDFRQREPQAGAPASEPTVVRAAYSDTHLYRRDPGLRRASRTHRGWRDGTRLPAFP